MPCLCRRSTVGDQAPTVIRSCFCLARKRCNLWTCWAVGSLGKFTEPFASWRSNGAKNCNSWPKNLQRIFISFCFALDPNSRSRGFLSVIALWSLLALCQNLLHFHCQSALGFGRYVAVKTPRYNGPVNPEPLLRLESQRACQLSAMASKSCVCDYYSFTSMLAINECITVSC